MWLQRLFNRQNRFRKNRDGRRLTLERLEDRCLLDGSFGPWSAPVNLGPVVNSASSDQHPAISKDGLSLYITSDRSDLEGAQGKLDIWVSQRSSTNDPWGTPRNLGPAVNSGSDDRVPTFSRDGHWMFFGSTRPGGAGGIDLWASYRTDVHDDFAWQAPVNLGAVNSPYDDDGATLFADDDTGITTLYFTSTRPHGPNGATDFDIYSSTTNPDGTFTVPAPVTELNSPGRDTRTAIRHDGLEMFITSDRTGSVIDPATNKPSIDLWVSSRQTTHDLWSTPINLNNLGSIINTFSTDGAPAISADSLTLYFYSNRSGSQLDPVTGKPTNDLWMTTRSKVSGGKAADPEAAVTSHATLFPTAIASVGISDQHNKLLPIPAEFPMAIFLEADSVSNSEPHRPLLHSSSTAGLDNLWADLDYGALAGALGSTSAFFKFGDRRSD